MKVQSLAAASLAGSSAEGDAALVARAQRDDAEAFSAIYERHARYIAGVAFRLLGDDAELDDVVQETFLDACQGIHALHDAAAVRAWLVTIAVRRVKKLLGRRRRRLLFFWEASEMSARFSDPRARQPVDELYDALDRLPPDLRVPWVLSQIEQVTLPDVARYCDVSLATVKRRISQADERLARRLGR